MIDSFTDTDPDDFTGLEHHGSNRGSKSVVLLNYNDDEQQLPDDSISRDILITEVIAIFNSHYQLSKILTH